MNLEEAIEYLNESDEENFACEILEIPEDLFFSVLDDVVDSMSSEEILDVKQKALADLQEACERKYEALLDKYARPYREKYLEDDGEE